MIVSPKFVFQIFKKSLAHSGLGYYVTASGFSSVLIARITCTAHPSAHLPLLTVRFDHPRPFLILHRNIVALHTNLNSILGYANPNRCGSWLCVTACAHFRTCPCRRATAAQPFIIMRTIIAVIQCNIKLIGCK